MKVRDFSHGFLSSLIYDQFEQKLAVDEVFQNDRFNNDWWS
ncbi:hypothetical protein [Paenibacillus sp. L3-i20]|nr:hypothetical protein [Paenibacillus sp. L3-i20]GKU78726.1 hypothetical protein L3i20_v231230 [Paenibacillus sp. L3-i20]